MGFFSMTCAKTHLPVVVPEIGIPQLNEVVALYPDGTKREGSWDGYGRIDGREVVDGGYDDKKFSQIKFVLKSKYAGEAYSDLGKSGREIGQGFFLARPFLHHSILKGAYKNYAEYKRTFNKFGG